MNTTGSTTTERLGALDDTAFTFRPNNSFIKVFSIFMAEPDSWLAGVDVCKKARLRSGVVYPLLNDLEKKHWLTAEWESNSPAERRGRPPKKLYQSTRSGLQQGRKLIVEEFPYLPVALASEGAIVAH